MVIKVIAYLFVMFCFFHAKNKTVKEVSYFLFFANISDTLLYNTRTNYISILQYFISVIVKTVTGTAIYQSVNLMVAYIHNLKTIYENNEYQYDSRS